jgi:hypothetical protein
LNHTSGTRFHKLDIRSRVELTRAVLTHEPALENDRRLDGGA